MTEATPVQERPRTAGAPSSRWRLRGSLGLFLARVILIVAFLVLWQVAAGRLIDPFFISQPSAIWQVLVGWMQNGDLVFNLWTTTEELVVGFLIGAVSALVFGIVFGLNRTIGALLEPFILAVYSVPKIALMPLFIVWFGIALFPKIVLAAVSVFFVVFFTTFTGVREVDQSLIDVLKVMGAGRNTITRKVIIPASLSWIFAGLKISVPQAFIGAVAGEILVSNRGLGFLVEQSATQFNTAGVFAGLIVITLYSTLVGLLLNFVERHFMRWRVSQ